MGLNYRFAFTFPNTIRGLVGVCGGIPGDWDSSSTYHYEPWIPVLNRVRCSFDELWSADMAALHILRAILSVERGDARLDEILRQEVTK